MYVHKTDKVPLPNADDENRKSSVPLTDNICHALKIFFMTIYTILFFVTSLPATSSSSWIVATPPGGCHEQEETPDAHRAPNPKYDTDDCEFNKSIHFTLIDSIYHAM